MSVKVCVCVALMHTMVVFGKTSFPLYDTRLQSKATGSMEHREVTGASYNWA